MEDGFLSDRPVHSSCIYKSKYDVTTYNEKASHLNHGEKVDLIENVFVPEKNFRFPETTRSFEYGWPLLFPLLCYSPGEDTSYYLSCVFLAMIFPLNLIGLKIYFHSSSSAVSYFNSYFEGKKKKTDPSHESVKNLHYSTWAKREAIFSQIKSSSHEINLLCDRKYKHEVEKHY